MARKKILVVDSDLDQLSRIYLSLLHRNYNVEASDKDNEITERIKRFKPALIIIGQEFYQLIKTKLKITAIVLLPATATMELNYGDIKLVKPFQMEELLKLVEEWII